MLRLKARLLHAHVHLPLVGIILASAGLSAAYALRATHWAVMTDELQTAKLATSIAETFSPWPQIHGERYGPPSQLYPLLLAPLFALFSVPHAVAAAHALNAVLLASAAVPAYLLGRAVTGMRAGGIFAAALTAFVPWLVLSTTLLTENAAYPAFVWSLFLAHRTIVAPSPGRDAAALAALLVAFLARTQLVVLAAVLPLAIVVHELARAAGDAPRGAGLRALGAAARRAVTSHLLLVVAAGVAAVAVMAVGGLDRVFGQYREVFRGDLLPPGIWRAAAEHLAYVVVGVGVVSFLLAGAWAVPAFAKPRRREAHAFAVLFLALVPALVLQAASFDLRFAAGGFVQDRYLAYLAPVFAVGAAAALLDRDRRGLRAVLVLGFGVVFSALASFATFPPFDAIFWASPASAFHGALVTAAAWGGLSAESLVRIGALALGAVFAAVVWRAPGVRALAATGAATVAFGVAEVVYVFDRFALPVTTQDDTVANVDRDWIDAFLPDGSSVALVPYAYLPPDVWWDAEFWNESIDRVLEIYGPTFVPFPVERVNLDLATGAVSGLPERRLFLFALEDTRLRLAGTTTVLTAPPLTLVQVARPARAEWSTRGADADGWSRPGRPVRLRFYAAGQPGLRDVRIALEAATETVSALPFEVTAGGEVRRDRVAADEVITVRLPVCVPAGGHAEATLLTPQGVRIRDGRVVGLHLDGVEATPTGRPC
jgi:hypothetical protein